MIIDLIGLCIPFCFVPVELRLLSALGPSSLPVQVLFGISG